MEGKDGARRDGDRFRLLPTAGHSEGRLGLFLRPGGVLITCSCSYHIDEATFLAMLEEAAGDAHCRMRVLAVRTQAADHPILLGVRETRYLKCVFLERL